MTYNDYKNTSDYCGSLKALSAEGITGKLRKKKLRTAFRDYCTVMGYTIQLEIYTFKLTDNRISFGHFAADSRERIEEWAQEMGYGACSIEKFTGDLANYPHIHKI